MTDHDVAELIEEYHPDFEWDRFKEIARALRWELYMGPQEDDYWTEIEPLEHYKWTSFVQAEEDAVVALSELPYCMYLDTDFDTLFLDDPETNNDYWVEDDEDGDEGEWVYVGPMEYREVIVPEELLGDALYNLIYQ